MSVEKTDAIVLKTVDFMESSLVLAVYTRDFGKIRGIAKGARRAKNPFETSLDLLASVKLSFIRKRSNALDLFTEAKLARRFRPNARNQRGLYAGYYVAEMLDRMTEDGDPDPTLWRLADLVLAALARRARVGSRVFAFEAKLLESFGEFPSTRHCVECGEELPLDRVENTSRRIWFETDRGGVVCKRCLASRRFPGLVPTTIGALKALEAALEAADKLLLFNDSFDQYLEGQYRRAENAFATARDAIAADAEVAREVLDQESLAKLETFDSDSRDALRALLNQCFARVSGRPPRALGYLGYATRGEPFPLKTEPTEDRPRATDVATIVANYSGQGRPHEKSVG